MLEKILTVRGLAMALVGGVGLRTSLDMVRVTLIIWVTTRGRPTIMIMRFSIVDAYQNLGYRE